MLKKNNILKKKKFRFFKTRVSTPENLYFKKKVILFFKRKLFYYKNTKFTKCIIIRLRSNNVFCTFNDNVQKKTLFSCAASRYKIKITAKKLKYQISRIITFFYHDIKRKINSRSLIIKIISPKFLRIKVYYLCLRFFSRYKLKQLDCKRTVLYYLNSYKSFNGCRVNKKRRKKRRRRLLFKKI